MSSAMFMATEMLTSDCALQIQERKPFGNGEFQRQSQFSPSESD